MFLDIVTRPYLNPLSAQILDDAVGGAAAPVENTQARVRLFLARGWPIVDVKPSLGCFGARDARTSPPIRSNIETFQSQIPAAAAAVTPAAPVPLCFVRSA